MQPYTQWPGQQAQDNPYDDLASFDGQYQAQAAFRAPLDTLSNGDYDFEIIDAVLDRAQNASQDRIVKFGMHVLGGRTVEHTYWLSDQKGMNRLGADLVVLGIDADKWGSATGRSIATELPKALPRLKGKKFRGTKTSRNGTGTYAGRVFHELFINCLLDGRPMPPLSPPAANGVQAPAPSPATQGSTPIGSSSDSIPF